MTAEFGGMPGSRHVEINITNIHLLLPPLPSPRTTDSGSFGGRAVDRDASSKGAGSSEEPAEGAETSRTRRRKPAERSFEEAVILATQTATPQPFALPKEQQLVKVEAVGTAVIARSTELPTGDNLSLVGLPVDLPVDLNPAAVSPTAVSPTAANPTADSPTADSPTAVITADPSASVVDVPPVTAGEAAGHMTVSPDVQSGAVVAEVATRRFAVRDVHETRQVVTSEPQAGTPVRLSGNDRESTEVGALTQGNSAVEQGVGSRETLLEQLRSLRPRHVTPQSQENDRPFLARQTWTPGGRAAVDAEDAPESSEDGLPSLADVSSAFESSFADAGSGDGSESPFERFRADVRSIQFEAGTGRGVAAAEADYSVLQNVFRAQGRVQTSQAVTAGRGEPVTALAGARGITSGGQFGAAGADVSFLQIQVNQVSFQAVRQPLAHQAATAIFQHVSIPGQQTSSRLTIRLDPPDLGPMTIEVRRSAEGLRIRVTATEPITLDMLMHRGQEIEGLLRSRDLRIQTLEFSQTSFPSGDGSFSFSHGGGRQRAGDPSDASAIRPRRLLMPSSGTTAVAEAHSHSAPGRFGHLRFRA
ncbi:MAG: flagellar hook-length control protein FliK [Planctomycetaceae bacterium]|nr:flagellar hook-length control protein FliK [Planctomycetaceae bacterium]